LRSSLSAFFFSSRRRHTRFSRDWSSDVCSSDLRRGGAKRRGGVVSSREPSARIPPRPRRRRVPPLLARRGTVVFPLLSRGGVARSEERRVGRAGRTGRLWGH